MSRISTGRAVAAAIALVVASPATASVAQGASSSSVAQAAGGASAAATTQVPTAKRRYCGRTIRTVYHSCTFGRHVAGVYKKRAGHGYFEANLVSANSGNVYYVECDGWDYITCYTDSGRITFRVSRIKR